MRGRWASHGINPVHFKIVFHLHPPLRDFAIFSKELRKDVKDKGEFRTFLSSCQMEGTPAILEVTVAIPGAGEEIHAHLSDRASRGGCN